MFKASVYCFLIFFIFENAVVHGLVNEGDIEQRSKVISVERLHDKSLLKETKLSTVLLNHDKDVSNTAKSAKQFIKNNSATHNTNDNKTSDLKFKSLNLDEDKTDEDNENNTKKEKTLNKSSTVTDIIGTTKAISDTNIDNENRTEITLNTEDTTMISDLTTDNGNENSTIITASSSETSSTISSSQSPISDSATSMKSLTAKEIASTDEPLQSVAPVEEKHNEIMSSGIIALVMAIVFAIVVIIVYIALLVWRRYLEYRYGNRELLVNDLEFDTNDLRHFEL